MSSVNSLLLFSTLSPSVFITVLTETLVFMCEVCLLLITEGSTRLTYTVRIGEDKNTELFVYYNG